MKNSCIIILSFTRKIYYHFYYVVI